MICILNNLFYKKTLVKNVLRVSYPPQPCVLFNLVGFHKILLQLYKQKHLQTLLQYEISRVNMLKVCPEPDQNNSLNSINIFGKLLFAEFNKTLFHFRLDKIKKIKKNP